MQKATFPERAYSEEQQALIREYYSEVQHRETTTVASHLLCMNGIHPTHWKCHVPDDDVSAVQQIIQGLAHCFSERPELQFVFVGIWQCFVTDSTKNDAPVMFVGSIGKNHLVVLGDRTNHDDLAAFLKTVEYSLNHGIQKGVS